MAACRSRQDRGHIFVDAAATMASQAMYRRESLGIMARRICPGVRKAAKGLRQERGSAVSALGTVVRLSIRGQPPQPVQLSGRWEATSGSALAASGDPGSAACTST